MTLSAVQLFVETIVLSLNSLPTLVTVGFNYHRIYKKIQPGSGFVLKARVSRLNDTLM